MARWKSDAVYTYGYARYEVSKRTHPHTDTPEQQQAARYACAVMGRDILCPRAHDDSVSPMHFCRCRCRCLCVWGVCVGVGVQVLAGFVNAIFLVFVGVSVVFEAVERLWEPPEIHGACVGSATGEAGRASGRNLRR